MLADLIKISPVIWRQTFISPHQKEDIYFITLGLEITVENSIRSLCPGCRRLG
jgi:hypothetical protein